MNKKQVNTCLMSTKYLQKNSVIFCYYALYNTFVLQKFVITLLICKMNICNTYYFSAIDPNIFLHQYDSLIRLFIMNLLQDALIAIKGGRIPAPRTMPSFEEMKETLGFNAYYEEEKRYAISPTNSSM